MDNWETALAAYRAAWESAAALFASYEREDNSGRVSDETDEAMSKAWQATSAAFHVLFPIPAPTLAAAIEKARIINVETAFDAPLAALIADLERLSGDGK